MDPAGSITSQSPAHTLEIGRRLGRMAGPGTVIALHGPLGAGKTQLAKGIAAGMEVPGTVNSPTFILMNEYAGRLRLFHVDAYRLEAPDQALEAGLLDERQAEGVTVIEWAERLADWLPDGRIEIEIVPVDHAADQRLLRWRLHGPDHLGLAQALRAGVAA
jgi:tRNA threonylcarbamoyladenosine biosynthesis protein TsaE